jgi:hypothetical protein
MNQRPGKTHLAALGDSQNIALRSLIDYVKNARVALDETELEHCGQPWLRTYDGKLK